MKKEESDFRRVPKPVYFRLVLLLVIMEAEQWTHFVAHFVSC